MSETHEESLEALLHETRTFPPPGELAKHANAQPDIYAEAQADPLAFWESLAAASLLGRAMVPCPRVGLAIRQVVRGRQAERRRQLCRSPR